LKLLKLVKASTTNIKRKEDHAGLCINEKMVITEGVNKEPQIVSGQKVQINQR